MTLTGLLCLAFVFSPVAGYSVFAQAAAAEDWAQPVNLSNSGAAADPLVLVDTTGVTHAFWFDRYAENHWHAQISADGAWSVPNQVSLPFGGSQPRLLMDADGLVSAFWTAEGAVYISRVDSALSGMGANWEPAQLLASNVISFDVSMDADQALHLAYISRSNVGAPPAGVYYRQKALHQGWTAEKSVYVSPYFRTMEIGQAHVNVAGGPLAGQAVNIAGETEAVARQVWVAWDEPSMARSLISRSVDDGKTWDAPVEFAPTSEATGPSIADNPDLLVWKNQALLMWTKKINATTCDLLYTVTADGQDWSLAASVFNGPIGCPESSDFLAQREDFALWQGMVNGQVILAAWDGRRWSEPQTQIGLAGFKDPDTGQMLNLGCRSLFYQADMNALHAAGCDLNGNQDIWYTHKSLGDLAAWFAPYSSWISPQELILAPFGAQTVNILTDSQGNFHALWTQVPPAGADSPPASSEANRVVFHSYWDGLRWSDPAGVVGGFAGSPLQLSVVVSPSDDLLAIWRAETGCHLSFSMAPASRAFSRLEWTDPVSLRTPGGSCSAPVLESSPGGEVYAAYTVAVNEGRGVYINRSQDGGRNWDQPIQVFDAAAAGWEMVDQPVFARSGSRLHLLWRRGDPLTPGVFHGLGYGYSDDGGQTWTATDAGIEASLQWAGLAASPDGLLLRVWQQAGADQSLIFTQISTDNGASWSTPTTVSSPGSLLGPPALAASPAGDMHFLQAIRDHLGKVTLRNWTWLDGNWAAGGSLDLGYSAAGSDFELAGAASQRQQLAVLYTTGASQGQSLRAAVSLVGASGESPQSPQATPEVVTPTVAPTLEAVAETAVAPTAAPEVTPTLANLNDGQPGSSNTWVGLILGIILAGVIVVGVFWARMTQTRS